MTTAENGDDRFEHRTGTADIDAREQAGQVLGLGLYMWIMSVMSCRTATYSFRAQVNSSRFNQSASAVKLLKNSFTKHLLMLNPG